MLPIVDCSQEKAERVKCRKRIIIMWLLTREWETNCRYVHDYFPWLDWNTTKGTRRINNKSSEKGKKFI